MPGSVDTYRAELKKLKDWEPYLKKHSGLPGPRANLELVAAVAEEADPDRLWRLSASRDEFLALCGTAGLGRVALMEPETVAHSRGLPSKSNGCHVRSLSMQPILRFARL